MATAPNPHLTLSSSSSPSQKSDADIRLSAIDIGSNSIRQIIADVSPTGVIRVVDEMKAAPELTYLFRHALAQDAVYENLLIAKRRLLHQRVAECLAQIYADRPQEVVSLLAFHFARAEDWDQALKFMLESAQLSSS